jgi:hypothetical protein
MKSPSAAPGCSFCALLQVDLLEIVLNRLDHLDHAPQAQIAGIGIELGADVVLGTVAVARAARWIASSIASMTMALSIIFSDATLLAMAISSALLADMAVAIWFILPFRSRPPLPRRAAW